MKSSSRYGSVLSSAGESGEKQAVQGELLGLSRSMNIARRALSMGCPYLEAMEEAGVKDLLFSSGEARLRLLCWFTGRLHPRLQELLCSTESSTALPTIPKLTAVLADVGLCRREDYELVQGKTPLSRQVAFLEALFDLLESYKMDSNSLNDSSLVPNMNCIPQKFEQCTHFIDNLCSQEHLNSVFPTSLSLLPPGLAKITSADFASSLATRTKRSDSGADGSVSHPTVKRGTATSGAAGVSLTALSTQIEELQSVIEEKQLQLERLMQSHDYAPLNTSALESCHKSLVVSLSTLSQLIKSFCHSYEVEIQPWTNREPPTLTTLGPTCKRVDNKKQQLDKLLQCITRMDCTLQRLEALQPATISQEHMSELLQSIQQTFKDCTEVISERQCIL